MLLFNLYALTYFPPPLPTLFTSIISAGTQWILQLYLKGLVLCWMITHISLEPCGDDFLQPVLQQQLGRHQQHKFPRVLCLWHQPWDPAHPHAPQELKIKEGLQLWVVERQVLLLAASVEQSHALIKLNYELSLCWQTPAIPGTGASGLNQSSSKAELRGLVKAPMCWL